jgi:RHS repeat-associated protein
LVGPVLAASLVAGMVVGAESAASAAPPAAPSAAAPSSASGDLTAPDIASARTIARLQGKRVEVIGERTETTTTYALPDGSMATGKAAAPIWVRKGGDGTHAGDWAAVDLTLETAADGSVRPKVHPAGLTLAGAGVPKDGLLLSMQHDAKTSMGLEWAGSLPKPRLEGPRAVYPEVQPGVDLVVEATRTGYEQYFVLTRKPDADHGPDLGLKLRASGLDPVATADGGVEVKDAKGAVVASSATPLTWDAGVDAERQHPVAKPWAKGSDAATALAPMPDWGNKAGSRTPAKPAPTRAPGPPSQADATAAMPPGSDNHDAGRPGHAGGKDAVAARASTGLPMTSTAHLAGPGRVELALSPDQTFLQDAATAYPVVVDPDMSWTGWWDTWVQTGYSSDQSGSPELRLGSYDGGADVARSFINLNLNGIRYTHILSAQLSLFEIHSYSCQARDWEVWDTYAAGAGTRINAQPGWDARWSTSSQTRGYSSACAGDWVGADITSLIQSWVNYGAQDVTVGLKARDERDSYAWKKFQSGNAGWGLPTLYVNWVSPPSPATGLTVGGAVTDGGTNYTTTVTPSLSATAHDADGAAHLRFRLYRASGALLWEQAALDVPNGSAGSVNVPPGVIPGDGQYTFEVYSYDWLLGQTGNTVWYPFTVDTTAPAAPTVSSADYPSDGTWHKGETQAGTFTVTLPADASMAGLMWGLDAVPSTRVAGTGAVNLSVTPPTNGRHQLQVRAVDRAGNLSAGTVKYGFNVGRAGLTSPTDGSQVVRRVRLAVAGEPGFKDVKFRWRRGPDDDQSWDIPLPNLTRADGHDLSGWTALADLGDYATWDAGATLGQVPGPVQVQAVMAADGTGTGAYSTPWVTVTVSPDARNAATSDVGPGSTNLLTGDYQLSSTDVDEFGLSLGRTASSRDPRAGLEEQQELIPSSATSVSSLDALTGGNAKLARATNRGHTGMDSVSVTANGNGADTWAAITTLPALDKGGSYRISGWIYVPAATGTTPDQPDGRGLRILARYQDAGGTWQQVTSPAATKTDAWQQLTVDVTIPADATSTGSVRFDAGFTDPAKAVFYDDLSVRKIWAPFGPQWSLGTADGAAGTAYTTISQPYPDVATLHLSDGGEVWFTNGGQLWWPEPGAEGLTLTTTGDGAWRLAELDGTVSEFARQPGATDAQLVRTSAPAAPGATRLVYETSNGVSRLARMIAPVEPGVDGAPANAAACTTAVPVAGCQVLQLVYATGTTAAASSVGDIAGQVSQVQLWSSPDATAATTAVTAVQYAYDTTGRLRQVWDPRISPALKTSYAYDDDGRVTILTPPGELPWTFRYGSGGASASVGAGDVIDRSSGRLLTVSRQSLLPGKVDQPGPDTTTTLVYAVPLNRNDGGPYDLDPDHIDDWAQRGAPTDATAVFGPDDPPAVTTASKTTPGADGYRPATVHYLDGSGSEVNTASPAGPDAPAAGYIDSSEFDRYGNEVRSLDATNRLLALGQLSDAAGNLSQLGLSQMDPTARAVELSSTKTYSGDGLDLLREQGPRERLAIGNDPGNQQLVHDVTTYAYDEGKPDGAAYHLVTTKTDAVSLAGVTPEQLLDVTVTKNGYDPIDGAPPLGPTSGWVHKGTTSVTVDAGTGGLAVTARVRYNDQGRAVESREAGSSGTDAATKRTTYYTAGANPDPKAAECGGTPGYAGWPCKVYVAGAATGSNAATMAAALPVKTTTAYNRYGSVAAVTESATGPVAGASQTQTRTTTTTYDDADRVTSVAITGSGPGLGAVGKTTNAYDDATGHVTAVTATDPATGKAATVRKVFDQLGRVTRYDDGNGGVTDSVFDAYGKPTKVTDDLGTSTAFTYDRSKEPRGFVTSVTDSVAGTLTASYGPDGQLTSQGLPGGVTLQIGYDPSRSPVSRKYVRDSDKAVVASASVVANGSGEWVSSTTDASSKRYSYDRVGRLTDVQDTTPGVGVCTWRRYGYDTRAQRTSLATAASATGTCVDPGNAGGTPVSTVGYTYDTADRLVSDTQTGAGAWVYDPLGRITTAPVRGSPNAHVTNTYYVNDRIASQQIDGVAKSNWSLDPLQRISSFTSSAWAAGADGQPGWPQAVTKVDHYDSDGDSPAWIAEDASLPDSVTRYVDGLDGNLAVQTGKTGARELQLVDLHGDVMGTLPIRDGADTADWTALQYKAADEFGNPTYLTTGGAVTSNGAAPGKDDRYGWLGGKQRSAEALAGVVLMGVRLYDPGTGRFWSTDPEPGGNATAYDYCAGDPVACSDLDGNWGWGWLKKTLKVVAKVAEVASYIPGPVGAAAAGVSAIAYASTGNKGKALEMGITAAAGLVGAGAAVRAGAAAWRAGGSVAARVGRTTMATVRGTAGRRAESCMLPGNSFTPETAVLMADGTTLPISQVQVGDFVASRDPSTGEVSAQPVLDVIVGVGDRHLLSVTTAPTPPGSLEGGEVADRAKRDDTWTATANHPVWVDGRGWTEADELRVGDVTVGAGGTSRVIVTVRDRGWRSGQTVVNLSVANVHTFIVGALGRGATVHNCSASVPHFTAEQSALIKAAKSAKKSGGVSREEALRLDAARERANKDAPLKLNGHGPAVHPGRGWSSTNVHINIGPVKHIPVR